MPDLQSACLLPLFFASPRCSYVLRALPPEALLAFAESYEAAIAACDTDLLAGLRPRDRPAPFTFPAGRPQLALWNGSCSGLLGFVGGRAACAAAQTPTFGGKGPCQAPRPGASRSLLGPHCWASCYPTRHSPWRGLARHFGKTCLARAPGLFRVGMAAGSHGLHSCPGWQQLQ